MAKGEKPQGPCPHFESNIKVKKFLAENGYAQVNLQKMSSNKFNIFVPLSKQKILFWQAAKICLCH